MATFKKVGVITLLIILLIGGGTMSFLYMGSYSVGTRTGKITKISKKGYVFKTIEGELMLTDVNSFPFSVDTGNEEVYQALEKYAKAGTLVTLHYEEKFVQFSWRGDTKHFIIKVEQEE